MTLLTDPTDDRNDATASTADPRPQDKPPTRAMAPLPILDQKPSGTAAHDAVSDAASAPTRGCTGNCPDCVRRRALTEKAA